MFYTLKPMRYYYLYYVSKSSEATLINHAFTFSIYRKEAHKKPGAKFYSA